MPVISLRLAFVVLFLACLVCDPSPAGAGLSPELERRVASDPEESVVAWVHFTDRAGTDRDPATRAAARARLTVRSLERRARRGVLPEVVAGDLPVHEPYVRALIARGARLRGTSRWLNAASVEIPAALAPELARLPFVARVALVPRGRPVRPAEPATPVPIDSRSPVPPAHRTHQALAPGDTAYYGGSFRQLEMMQVPALHALGLSGAGVLVCMLDSGYHLGHAALANLDIVATRDFIHGDLDVDYDPGQDVGGQADHGTTTLSCAGGHLPGTFSGSAFGATFALGKTENTASETPVEMDYWQFGAEWADSLGADVISSSLGYYEFDNTAESYTYADMDGRTTVVTLAAVEAMRRGITVVTAAGNTRATPWHYLVAPSDADTVLGVGAVDSLNVLTTFTAPGPSADGRIKPDVTAMGRRVLSILPVDDVGYFRQSGTSLSTPLVAGLVALLLESHPGWGPWEVREALRETALNQSAPDNDIGWGLVQGLAANAFVPHAGVPPPLGGSLRLAAGPNPLRGDGGATIRFEGPEGLPVTVDVVDVAGRHCIRLFEGTAGASRVLTWNGSDASGRRVPAGVYWVRVATEARSVPKAHSVRLVVLP